MAEGTIDQEKLGGAAEIATDRLTTSTRDQADLGRRVQRWLAAKLVAGAEPEVTDVVKPEGNGMSSETLLFTARWNEGDQRTEQRFAARIEPELDKIPLFPTYDLRMQFDVISLVAESTDVPVPETHWYEPSADVVGAPFFVMTRVDGEVPRDVLPYTFPDANFVFDATAEERARMQRSAVRALAGIHTVTPDTHDLSALAPDRPGATSLERTLATWEAYLEWATASERSPLLDACFAWLRDHLPTEGVDTGPPCLSWGDSRIGNMLFVDHEVTGVLDWEMAGIAPPEVDLGWMAYMHLFFQDITTDLDAEGLPDFMRPVDLAGTYAELTGRIPGDLTWPMAFAAMRHGVIMRRVTERAVLFGEAERPDDVDDMIIHRATLRAMLAGTYWDAVAR